MEMLAVWNISKPTPEYYLFAAYWCENHDLIEANRVPVQSTSYQINYGGISN